MDSAYDFNRDEDEDDFAGEFLPPVIGGSERRMHVRAYEYWTSLLNGRACPSIHDLDPASISDFGPHSVLLDFSRELDNPTVTYLGRALREECDMLYGIRTVADVPARSLVSRLTDPCMQIIANRAPIGFEAEFTNHRGLPTLYRGILMPFSSDGDTIDYVYGVINWKHAAPDALSDELEREVAGALGAAPSPPEAAPVWPEAERQPETHLLHHWLAAARLSAEGAEQSEGRAHSALYAAIGRAYDFALAADEQPEAYAALLEAEGVTAQARAPMTPIVKLVFGAAYDKTRLTEYAAALSHARREGIARGNFADYLNGFEGGLKAVVRVERALRAPASKPNRAEQARTTLRAVPAKAEVDFECGDDEFVILVARRTATGRLALLAPVTDASLIDKALCKAAA
ncbi:hypothetical protein SCH01S_15_00440 [Sphingomonas changbaiensis NBRC 104936]|uniref:Uncharacterized protein n=1 Tax=Sphingomonas changbaiensis NBRC 104936 TaxID=1219043 RepID=A0A0E9MLM1_9SPHN|nr:hypothetical protein [Sphingomonas changbaiensis]GAO38419.1 hypothetical protein SCH01S_15_00440 [Sphingomonas changbaiensis NBRC 104936]